MHTQMQNMGSKWQCYVELA